MDGAPIKFSKSGIKLLRDICLSEHEAHDTFSQALIQKKAKFSTIPKTDIFLKMFMYAHSYIPYAVYNYLYTHIYLISCSLPIILQPLDEQKTRKVRLPRTGNMIGE